MMGDVIGIAPVLLHGGEPLKYEQIIWGRDALTVTITYPGTPWPKRPDDWRKQLERQGWRLVARMHVPGDGGKAILIHLTRLDKWDTHPARFPKDNTTKLAAWNAKVGAK